MDRLEHIGEIIRRLDLLSRPSFDLLFQESSPTTAKQREIIAIQRELREQLPGWEVGCCQRGNEMRHFIMPRRKEEVRSNG